MTERPHSRLPDRWRDLDKRTIELIARMNEEERQHLVTIMNLSDKELRRLKQFLALPDEKWQAGFKIVTRSAAISAGLRSVPRLILGIAAFLVAADQIWKFVSPWLLRSMGK